MSNFKESETDNCQTLKYSDGRFVGRRLYFKRQLDVFDSFPGQRFERNLLSEVVRGGLVFCDVGVEDQPAPLGAKSYYNASKRTLQ
jgi:hypothetical protein